MFPVILCVFFSSHIFAEGGFLPTPIDGYWNPYEIEGEAKNVFAWLFLLPKKNLDRLSVRIKIPKGIHLLSGKTKFEYNNLEANKIVEIKLVFSIVEPTEQKIIASAILVDTPAMKMGKAFVLRINPVKKEVEHKILKNKQGDKLIVY